MQTYKTATCPGEHRDGGSKGDWGVEEQGLQSFLRPLEIFGHTVRASMLPSGASLPLHNPPHVQRQAAAAAAAAAASPLEIQPSLRAATGSRQL